jgi:hypothetical protein
MPRTTNAAGRIRDESLMNLGGRAKKLLHPEYFSKRFLPSLPSRNIQSKFDLRVLGHLYFRRHSFLFKLNVW